MDHAGPTIALIAFGQDVGQANRAGFPRMAVALWRIKTAPAGAVLIFREKFQAKMAAYHRRIVMCSYIFRSN